MLCILVSLGLCVLICLRVYLWFLSLSENGSNFVVGCDVFLYMSVTVSFGVPFRSRMCYSIFR